MALPLTTLLDTPIAAASILAQAQQRSSSSNHVALTAVAFQEDA
jgi:hypothetical protein